MKKLESTLTNMVLSLTLITIVATSILAAMNEVTKAPIEAANRQALEAALAEVLPEGSQAVNPDGELVADPDGIEYTLYEAVKEGKPAGAAVESTVNGFGGKLKIIVGFDNNGVITNYSVLEHSETPGLGAKCADWFKKGMKGDITGKNPAEANLTVSKDGGEIDAITASTITSRAFLKAVANAYKTFMARKPMPIAAEAVRQAEAASQKAIRAMEEANQKEERSQK